MLRIAGCPTTEAIGELVLEPGGSIAIIGPNGSGKTSLLRFVALGTAPYPIDMCKVYVGAKILDSRDPSERARLGIHYIPSERLVFPELTVEENIKLGMVAGNIPRSERRKILEEIYTLLPIMAQRRNQLAGTLSGGEQKILSIARALSARARILLIDEPSAGLAPKAIDTIYDLFKKLRSRGVSIIIAEQSVVPFVRNQDAVDTVYVAHNRRILAAYKPKDLLGVDVIRNYFGLKG
ncbi:branched-chain amino acid ABC transporter ATP-binding protein [Desulfurococcaceae archaeon AG1]|jgi:branched-chain amino acid transport system ATP-binding protein|nr:MAG: branched-chain amino acid ABC transporter ATP-binding protein [Desulfurococcaceae archaeon]GAY25092.1 branched-chain amino acid ABC transporter ATP-binding protein [Desulfurococcaceae archaeon AG1]